MNPDRVYRILDKHNGNNGGLISILEEIQGVFSYLPKDALEIVAEETSYSFVDIYGVATFYRSFSLQPRGKHLVSICMGTACHVRRSPLILDRFADELGISAGETTSDKEFTLETVNCLGACALGPVVVVDGHYFTNVNTTSVKDIIRKTQAGLDKVDVENDERVFQLRVSCPRCNHSLMDDGYKIDNCPSIRVTVSFKHRHGWLRLSSLYGSYNIKSEYELPQDETIDIFCPHCHTELMGVTDCPECGIPMIPLIVRGGGTVQICSRLGCKGHLLDIV